MVKKNNSFLRPGLNGALFSAEKGNLYNKNSFKYSGALSQRREGLARRRDGYHFVWSRCRSGGSPGVAARRSHRVSAGLRRASATRA